MADKWIQRNKNSLMMDLYTPVQLIASLPLTYLKSTLYAGKAGASTVIITSSNPPA